MVATRGSKQMAHVVADAALRAFAAYPRNVGVVAELLACNAASGFVHHLRFPFPLSIVTSQVYVYMQSRAE